VSVELNNSKLFGDNVGVVTRWNHPGAKEADLSPGNVTAIKEAVGSEPRWRNYSTADLWVGKAIAPILGLNLADDEIVIKNAIKKLLATGALKEVLGRDSKRVERTFVVSGDASAPALGVGRPEKGGEG
jgi:hypothetical protein